MSTVTHGAPALAAPSRSRARARKFLLACGPLSALTYVGWHELAALQWDGYSRISNAISELHLTGAPTKSFLDPWQGLVYNALLAAFGLGVWLSARDKRSLRVIGVLMMAPVATLPLWMLFSEASLAAHIGLAVVGIGTWVGAMACGAVALGKRFRIYSLATLVVVVAFNGLAFSYAPEVEAGQPTPFIGLDERVAFTAYFVWQTALAVVLWRRGLREDEG
jgi:hypothetical protein